MSYDTYLLVLSQLSTECTAKCMFNENEIYVESSSSENWYLSTKLLDDNYNKIPSFLKQSMNRSGLFRWQEKGAYIKFDPFSRQLLLVQEVRATKKFIPFKYLMNDFVQLANDWKNLLKY